MDRAQKIKAEIADTWRRFQKTPLRSLTAKLQRLNLQLKVYEQAKRAKSAKQRKEETK